MVIFLSQYNHLISYVMSHIPNISDPQDSTCWDILGISYGCMILYENTAYADSKIEMDS